MTKPVDAVAVERRDPLLGCLRCEETTRHEFAELIEGPFQWTEYWRCKKCGTLRVWGAFDPLKVSVLGKVPRWEQRF